jgi:RHS repeat-associated protein
MAGQSRAPARWPVSGTGVSGTDGVSGFGDGFRGRGFRVSATGFRGRDAFLPQCGGRLARLANYHSAWFSCGLTPSEGRRNLRSTNDGQGTTRRLTTSFDYTYDANSNITEISQDFMGAEVVTDYAYDEINRLTKETTCDYLNAYYYDDGGNRTKMVKMNAVYSKDGNGRIVSMLTKASASSQGLTKTYLYSNYTELTKMTASEYSGTTRDYTYEQDMAGRLTRQVQNVFSPNSTTTYNYEWDALDRMTKVQKVASGVTKTINYTYNKAAGLRVRRVDTSTNVTKLWTYAGNNIASVQTSSGGSYGSDDYVYTVGPGMINNVTERHKLNASGSDSRYYQYDHRGNVAAVTDANGKILRGYQYDAFGNIPFSFATGQSGAAPTDDILFTGKDLDPDTGLYYFNARWYDPETGTFVSRCPFPPTKEHPYESLDNNPLRHVDPSGSFRGPRGVGELWWDDCDAKESEACEKHCKSEGKEVFMCQAVVYQINPTETIRVSMPGMGCECFERLYPKPTPDPGPRDCPGLNPPDIPIERPPVPPPPPGGPGWSPGFGCAVVYASAIGVAGNITVQSFTALENAECNEIDNRIGDIYWSRCHKRCKASSSSSLEYLKCMDRCMP